MSVTKDLPTPEEFAQQQAQYAEQERQKAELIQRLYNNGMKVKAKHTTNTHD
jgi:hypothetical protein